MHPSSHPGGAAQLRRGWVGVDGAGEGGGGGRAPAAHPTSVGFGGWARPARSRNPLALPARPLAPPLLLLLLVLLALVPRTSTQALQRCPSHPHPSPRPPATHHRLAERRRQVLDQVRRLPHPARHPLHPPPRRWAACQRRRARAGGLRAVLRRRRKTARRLGVGASPLRQVIVQEVLGGEANGGGEQARGGESGGTWRASPLQNLVNACLPRRLSPPLHPADHACTLEAGPAMFGRLFGGGGKPPGGQVSQASTTRTVDAIQKLGEVCARGGGAGGRACGGAGMRGSGALRPRGAPQPLARLLVPASRRRSC